MQEAFDLTLKAIDAKKKAEIVTKGRTELVAGKDIKGVDTSVHGTPYLDQ